MTGINAEHALSGALNEVGELLAPLSKAVLEKLEVLEKTSKLWSKRVKYHSGDTCKARQNQSKKMMVY